MPFSKGFKITLENDNPSVYELIDVAIEREVVSREIYYNTAGQVFGNLAQLLEDLAAFEGEHETKLKDMRSYLRGEDRI